MAKNGTAMQIPSGIFILLLLFSAQAIAEIQTQLSSTHTRLNEPVRLTVEFINEPVAESDLSMLEKDFVILNRSVSRSSRNFNGRNTRRTLFNLTLLPKHSGLLSIPPIGEGAGKTAPITLSVAPTEQINAATSPVDAQASAPSVLDSAANPMATGLPWNSAPGWWAAPAPGWLDPLPQSQPQGWAGQAEEPSPITPSPPSAQPWRYWPWVAVVAICGWLVTSLFLLRSRLHMRASTAPTAVTQAEDSAVVEEEVDPRQLLDDVHKAYSAEDPFAAKQALLAWAAYRWADNPPTNLSRLAARCPEHLQRQILALDEALYSPEPIDWKREPVWRLLDGGQAETAITG